MYSGQIASFDQLQALNSFYAPVYEAPTFDIINLMDLNAPSLDLQSLKSDILHHKHTVEHLTTDKGTKVNMDFSKNAGESIIKHGKMGDIHDLHIK